MFWGGVGRSTDSGKDRVPFHTPCPPDWFGAPRKDRSEC